MRVITLNEEELYKLIDERHNPPVIQNQREQNLFQAEIRGLYNRLIQLLSVFGEEGDYYGVSDFAVRPDLRDRPTVIAPPASHLRQFTITVLTEEFFRSGFLDVLREFLCAEASGYRIWVEQDFDAKWSLTIILTAGVAWLNCTDSEEASRLHSTLARLTDDD